MRWQSRLLVGPDDDEPAVGGNGPTMAAASRPSVDGGLLPLSRLPGLVRTVRPPEFAGITFHEVLAKSALNHVPGTSPMPFSWTINPYRGCSHACTYCFARRTHEYLDFDSGRDFDTEIVVKTNVAQVLDREVSSPRWDRAPVALGTNTDPYQRAEGRYRLMPGIIAALSGSGTPFSILTKGSLAARDLPALTAAAERVHVGMGVSLAVLDEDLRRSIEPGAPSAASRLGLIRKITEAGLPCGVLIAPVLPFLTDSQSRIDDIVAAVAAAGATGITGIVLHLRPGARAWFFRWLQIEHPDLVRRYEQLYARGATAESGYRRLIGDRVHRSVARHGLRRPASGELRGVPGDVGAAFPAGFVPPRAAAVSDLPEPALF